MNYTPGAYAGTHVILTGPITGTVTLADGTVVDVTDPVIEAPPERHGEIAHLIGLRYQNEGHPNDPAFAHVCNDNCPGGE